MSDSDTRPGKLDDDGNPYHRRVTERKLESWANSALLKVLSYMISAILLPLMMWIGNTVQELNSVSKVNELRMTTLERAQSDRDAQIKVLTEKSIILDMEVRAIRASK